jgi:CO/xanthine dehydrogenase Mo-binding subunit
MDDLPAIMENCGWSKISPTARLAGVGESAMFGVSPAIANALAHAIGIRLTSLPLCAETVYRAICAKAGYPARGGKDVIRADVCRVTLVRGWS